MTDAQRESLVTISIVLILSYHMARPIYAFYSTY